MADGFIDDELTTFIEAGNAVMVATRNAALEPYAMRGAGIRVAGPDRIAVLLPRATSAQAIQNLQANGAIAVVVSSPVDYRTVQLKGRSLEIEPGSAKDLLTAEEQHRAFADACMRFGLSRKHIRNLWLFDNWRVTMQVTSAYRQTPGPGAGDRIEARRG